MEQKAEMLVTVTGAVHLIPSFTIDEVPAYDWSSHNPPDLTGSILARYLGQYFEQHPLISRLSPRDDNAAHFICLHWALRTSNSNKLKEQEHPHTPNT